jgi:hypothetical protein
MTCRRRYYQLGRRSDRGAFRPEQFPSAAVEKLWPSPQTRHAASSLRLTTGETDPYFKTLWEFSVTKRSLNLKIENIDSEKPITDIKVVINSIEPKPSMLARGP